MKLRNKDCWQDNFICGSHKYQDLRDLRPKVLLMVSWTLTYSSLLAGNLSSKSSTDSWLDSVLGQSRQGIFSADFEDDNNTWVELGDGENMTLDCRVFLKQDKTVKQEILSDVIWKLFTVSQFLTADKCEAN